MPLMLANASSETKARAERWSDVIKRLARLADITFVAKKQTSVEEVNAALKAAAQDPKWEGIFSVTEDPIVSSDIVGEPVASIADLGMTRVVDGNLVKVLAWYDNEMGYTESLVRHVLAAGA